SRGTGRSRQGDNEQRDDCRRHPLKDSVRVVRQQGTQSQQEAGVEHTDRTGQQASPPQLTSCRGPPPQGDRRMEISPEPSYPPLLVDASFSVGHRLGSGRTGVMEDSVERYDALIRSGAKRLTGYQRRSFQAEVATELCGGCARQAERRFGWGRETVEKGVQELRHGVRCVENFAARGRRRSEEQDPRLADDIRAIVEPHTYADPGLKSARRYTNLSATEVRAALIARGHAEEDLPGERTMRDILNRMNYRLKRIRKGKPLKEVPETDAIFANVNEVRRQARDDPEAVGSSLGGKAEGGLGGCLPGGV